MAQITRSTKISGGTTLTSNTTARAADVETDTLTLFNAHNNHDTGASKWQVVSAANSSSTVVVADNQTGSNNILEARKNASAVFTVDGSGNAQFTGTVTIPNTTGTITSATITTLNSAIVGYRRPVLQWQSITVVDVECNTGTANTTTILFPDGAIRTVTEDTGTAHKYRRFRIVDTANFTSGTEDTGLRSSLSEATNTWYAIYAVKSQINSSNFVLVGDTTLPTQANYSTLNSNFGTNGWVYLGLIRNGDGSAATGDILNFYQAGNKTFFRNQAAGGVVDGPGIRMVSSSGTTVTYTYASGTGAAQIPSNITFVDWTTNAASSGANFAIQAQTETTYYHRVTNTPGTPVIFIPSIPAAAGLVNITTTSTNKDMYLGGFVDGVLGIGGNPLL